MVEGVGPWPSTEAAGETAVMLLSPDRRALLSRVASDLPRPMTHLVLESFLSLVKICVTPLQDNCWNSTNSGRIGHATSPVLGFIRGTTHNRVLVSDSEVLKVRLIGI